MQTHPTDNLVRSLARVHDDALAGQAGRPAARRLMDEITAAPPQEAARPRLRPPRLAFRIAAVGTAAAIASVAGVTLVGHDDDGRPRQVIPHLGSVAQAALVLDRAAAAAKSRPYTAPGPQQWVYTKVRMTAPAVPSGIATGGPYKTRSWELWRRLDGKNEYAAYEDGKLTKSPGTETAPRVARFDPLPTDPHALLRKVGGTPESGYEPAFHTLVTVLAGSVHPPKTEAAIFQAIKLIPGVTATGGTVDAAGRPAITLGLIGREGWLRDEVLLDLKTYRYLGERSITVQDHAHEGDDGKKTVVKRGTLQFIEVRVAVGIVNEPGDRP
ncbi:CU044_5270 family protein [Spirillospora sp. CA-142024]|uniref:CU044_5270 family protein n=1 Tax=Spirillospora sp. CA-142024 TaxID=3240036 RepID=UPI003D8B1629